MTTAATHDHTIHNCRAHKFVADFATSDETIRAMVARLNIRIVLLGSYGDHVKGVTMTDAKDLFAEIRGGIVLLNTVCESRSLQDELHSNLELAFKAATDRLRRTK